MTEVSIVVLALAFIIQCFNHWKLAFKVKNLEDFIYSNMDMSHYPAIGNEFTEVWVAMDEVRDEIEKIKKNIGEEDGTGEEIADM